MQKKICSAIVQMIGMIFMFGLLSVALFSILTHEPK